MNEYVEFKEHRASVEHPSPKIGARSDEMHRAWIEVNLTNLVKNARDILTAANGQELLAVVKADAYGIGAVPATGALLQLNPWGFAVATIDEGIKLRLAGIDHRILVLQPAQMRYSSCYSHYSLIATIDQAELVDHWPTEFHVAIDTGMHREGIPWTYNKFDRLDWRRASGVFTHLHAADVCRESVLKQCQHFRDCLHQIPGKCHLARHVANSAGVWQTDERFGLIRPGIFLYGGTPGSGLPSPVPVVTVKSRITSLRTVTAGDTIGYGFDYRVHRDTEIATVGIGYADGIPLQLRNASVLVGGCRCRIVGRVTMDMIMVDVSNCGRLPFLGQSVVLIGSDSGKVITLKEFSESANTIPYEVLTRLSPRLPRIYVA